MTVEASRCRSRPALTRATSCSTPAQSIVKAYDGMGVKANFDFRTAVYINNGAYVPGQSVAAAQIRGNSGEHLCRRDRGQSKGPLFSAFVIDGDSAYTIKNPIIRMTGNGKNDFFGYGASVRAGGQSKVTIDGARIDNTGAVRTAIWVGDHADVTVNHAEIDVQNGTLPSDYGWKWTNGGPSGNGDVMMEVPWMLGLRATIAPRLLWATALLPITTPTSRPRHGERCPPTL